MYTDQCVVFDFDGTLTEGYPAILFQGLSEYFSAKHGKKIHFASPHALIEHGCSGIGAFQDIFKLHEIDFSYFFNDFLPHFENIYHQKVKVCAWVPSVLKNLRQRQHRLVICSNNKEKNVRKVMSEYQRYINNYHCLDDHRETLKHKPSKESYLSLQERHHVDLSKSIYVTDELRDANGARENGFGKVFLVTWGCSNLREHDQARLNGIKVIDDTRQLVVSLDTFLELRPLLR